MKIQSITSFVIGTLLLFGSSLAGVSTLYAQQYATDWIYLRQQNKANCRATTEKEINRIKQQPSMNNEHDEFMNRFAQTRSRSGLPMTGAQQQRLRNLATRKNTPPRQTQRQILLAKMSRYEWMRKRCK